MHRGAWQAIVPGVAESDTTEWLTLASTHQMPLGPSPIGTTKKRFQTLLNVRQETKFSLAENHCSKGVWENTPLQRCRELWINDWHTPCSYSNFWSWLSLSNFFPPQLSATTFNLLSSGFTDSPYWEWVSLIILNCFCMCFPVRLWAFQLYEMFSPLCTASMWTSQVVHW